MVNGDLSFNPGGLRIESENLAAARSVLLKGAATHTEPSPTTTALGNGATSMRSVTTAFRRSTVPTVGGEGDSPTRPSPLSNARSTRAPAPTKTTSATTAAARRDRPGTRNPRRRVFRAADDVIPHVRGGIHLDLAQSFGEVIHHAPPRVQVIGRDLDGDGTPIVPFRVPRIAAISSSV